MTQINNTELRIGIIGVGAIGSFLASQLHGLHELFYFNRSHKNNISVKTLDANVNFEMELSDPLNFKEDLDWIIVAVKEHHTKDVIDLVEKLSSLHTNIIVVRNGLLLVEPFEHIANRNLLIPCIINCSVEPNDDNSGYVQLSEGLIKLPTRKGSDEFKSLFNSDLLTIVEVDDFKTQAWMKVLESSAIGAITAMTGRTIEVFENQKYVNKLRALVREGIEVASSDGAKIPVDFTCQLVLRLPTYPKEKGSSMLTDKKLGRELEINAKSGCISGLGKVYNIETPLHDDVISHLRHD